MLIKSFWRREHGAIAVMFALMLPVLVGFIGLGVDVGMWYVERRSIQTVADTAAISAMYEQDAGSSSAEILSAAETDATKNGYDAATDTITVNIPPTSGAYLGDPAYIEVIVTRQLSSFLSEIILDTPPSATARAVSGITGADQEACVLALSPSAQNAIYLNGAGTAVSMEGCGVMSNSDNATKSVNVQNGTLDVDCIGAVGGINEGGTINTECGSTKENQTAIDDPYADLTIPAYSGCDLSGTGNSAYEPETGKTIGSYNTTTVICNGLTVNSGDSVTIASGSTIIIDEGDFLINGNASITGDEVTIILTASDGSGMGSVQITGGGTVDLSAPESGDFTGVLFYQDPDGGSSPSLDSMVTGGSEVELTGAVYLPNNDISFSGGNSVDGDGCLMLIAQTVSFNGDADIENECDMYGGNPMVYGGYPGLVE